MTNKPQSMADPVLAAGGTLVPSLLDRAVEHHGSRPAARDGSGAWTYRQLDRYSRAVASNLASLGIGTGARILSLLPGGRAFTALLYGALRQGAVVIPAAEDISDYQLRWLLADARPTLVVVPEDHAGRSVTCSVAPVVAASALLHADRAAPPGFLGTAPPAQDDAGRLGPDATALMIYTSGSTARPKGILCPHGTVVWAAHAVASTLGYRYDDIVYVRLPMSFDYGLYQILLCAVAGAEIVFPSEPMSAGELRAVRNSGATVLPLVPTLAAVLSRLAARDTRPTSLRLFSNTGAALVGPDAARLRSAFPNARLICMYGMSECKRITVARPDEDLTHPATVGRALPGTELFVVDEQGEVLPPGEVGQILSAGPHVMAGYWQAPDANAERFVPAPGGHGRAVATGDYGYLDHEGRLYFVGRRDDVFKRRGWRVSAQEIESAMLDIEGVEAAACVPPGPDGELTVWAVTGRTPRAVLRAVEERLGPAKVPDRCVVVDHLPQTPHGKIDKAALRRSAETTR
ncbi:class I adenylate-forming enzyme family protein [Streptomyces sp. NPDC057748]|uniref:class I adenylate-forming enzyme family protein n=1 Tax=unclassified Streptomyces TaxID=2593676 RepID=UPI003687455D